MKADLSLSLSLLRASSGESFFPPSVVLGEWRWRGGQADSTSSVPNAHLDIVIYGDLCCLHLRLVPSRPLRAQHSFFAIRRQTNSSFGGIQHKTIFCISAATNFRPSRLPPSLSFVIPGAFVATPKPTTDDEEMRLSHRSSLRRCS